MPLLRVTCAFCRWSAEGDLEATLAEQIAHRESEHGIVGAPRKRVARRLTKLSYESLPSWQRTEIEDEIARRRRLHGVGESAG